jgi:hypothetical protein
MIKSNVFTAVYRDITPDEAGEITHHPKWSAGSWSHALDDRSDAETSLQAANARIADLEQELRNIANADTVAWDDPTEFEAWAKSRARGALGDKREG